MSSVAWPWFYFSITLMYVVCSHRDADTDSVNTMVVHEDEGEAGEGEQAGGYGDQTMLVQRVSHLSTQWDLKKKKKISGGQTACEWIKQQQETEAAGPRWSSGLSRNESQCRISGNCKRTIYTYIYILHICSHIYMYLS